MHAVLFQASVQLQLIRSIPQELQLVTSSVAAKAVLRTLMAILTCGALSWIGVCVACAAHMTMLIYCMKEFTPIVNIDLLLQPCIKAAKPHSSQPRKA